jgi:membrane-bound serine protease (ClpP class)
MPTCVYLIAQMIHAIVLSSLLSLASTDTLAKRDSSQTTPADTTKAPAAKTVVVIPIHGEVDEGLQHFTQRAIDEALSSTPKPDVLVFDIDTWGGRLDAAFEISDAIGAVQQCSTSAFIARKAISAGALIALSTQRIYMAPGATIGDCAPIMQTQEGPKFLGEKIESPLRARFRALAKRSGVPAALAEKMVSKDLSVKTAKDTAGVLHWFSNQTWEELSDTAQTRYHDVRTVAEEGQLLTLDDQEALRWQFSGGTYENIDSLLAARKWQEASRLDPTWAETALRWISQYVSILFVLGLAALYLEYKMPGTGFFGILGVIFLGVALGSQFLLGMASYTALALAALGVLLIAIEVAFMPGMVFPAFAGLLCLLAALVLSLQGFTVPDPNMPWQAVQMKRGILQVLAAAVGAAVVSILAFRYLVPLLPFRDGPYLTATLAGAPGQVRESQPDLAGKDGICLTPLRPVGRIEVDGVEYDALSRTGMLDKGTPVRVVELSGAQWVVERTEKT